METFKSLFAKPDPQAQVRQFPFPFTSSRCLVYYRLPNTDHLRPTGQEMQCPDTHQHPQDRPRHRGRPPGGDQDEEPHPAGRPARAARPVQGEAGAEGGPGLRAGANPGAADVGAAGDVQGAAQQRADAGQRGVRGAQDRGVDPRERGRHARRQLADPAARAGRHDAGAERRADEGGHHRGDGRGRAARGPGRAVRGRGGRGRGRQGAGRDPEGQEGDEAAGRARAGAGQAGAAETAAAAVGRGGGGGGRGRAYGPDAGSLRGAAKLDFVHTPRMYRRGQMRGWRGCWMSGAGTACVLGYEAGSSKALLFGILC